MEETNQNQQAHQDSNNAVNNTVAVVAYITLIGFIIALIMNQNNKNELGSFHLREMLGLILFGVGIYIVGMIPFIGFPLYVIGALGLFVFWILGLINAVNKEKKLLPLIGDLFQKWFAKTF